MTSERRFEQDLRGLLDELYIGPTPGYRDHVLHHTARIRQRPAWSFPGRWLPMVDIARQPVSAPRLPWRSISLALLAIALLLAATAAFIGSQQHQLPAPFGFARNGLIAYDVGGDIYTADPTTGVATAVIAGPTTDLGTRFSRDGTQIVFERKAQDGLGRLYVATAHGQGLVPVTPEPRAGLANYAFSPDGSEVMFTSGAKNEAELWIAKADGSGLRQLDVGMGVQDMAYRPPNGAEIVFSGGRSIAEDNGPRSIEESNGLYAVDVATGQVRTILEPVLGVGRGFVRISPDGSRISYSVSTEAPGRNTYQARIVAADGSRDTILPMPVGATFQDAQAWSNDGRFLAVVRGYAARNQDMTLVVIPADGNGSGVETDHGLTGCCDTVVEWSPDDTTLLVKPFDLIGRPLPPLFWDPLTGATTPAPWTAISDPAWQRLAP